MIKGTIHQGDIIFTNIYAPNSGAPNYIKEFLIDLKGETDNNTTIVGDFNILLVPVDKSSRHKVNRET